MTGRSDSYLARWLNDHMAIDVTGWVDYVVWYLGGKVARSMGSKRGLKGIILLIWPTLLMCHKESSCGSLRDLGAALLGVKSRPS